MLLHKDNKLIYNNRAALKLPNNVYVDPNPEPCPIEGMVLFSEDLSTKIEVNFLETDKDAQTFLQEITESFERFEQLKETSIICTNALYGVAMTYSLSSEICEEYVFTLPGNTPALLNVCFEQKKDNPSDVVQYEQLVAEFLAGIAPIFNVEMDELGRIQLPCSVWHAFGIKAHDKVSCKLMDNEIHLTLQPSNSSTERTVDAHGIVVLPRIQRESLHIYAPCIVQATVKNDCVIIQAIGR